MHKRTALRWRLLITMTVGVFFAFGSFWIVQLMQNRDLLVDPNAFQNEPDYIVEKFSFVRMTAEGKPRYLFSGAKLTHRPIDDSSDVVAPVVQSLTNKVAPTTVTSLRAHVRHLENQVDLSGNVEVQRPESPTNRALRLRTEALTVFPDEDRMVSALAVEAKLGTSTIVGTGMQANNATGQVHFDSRGQLIYPPKAARGAAK